MINNGPFLALVLPFLDMSDLPPQPIPPMPVGASRIETHAGWYLSTDDRLEVEAGLVGAGYLVRFADDTSNMAGVLSARVAGTWFTDDGAETPQDRYWVGPFVRAEVGSDLMGRHADLELGGVNRAAFDLGFRYPLGPSSPSTGAIGIGYAVAHDRTGVSYEGIKHGVRLQLDFALR